LAAPGESDDRLLQEILLEQRDGHWKMLAGCIMLNQTTRTQVDRVWPDFFGLYPSAHRLAGDFGWALARELLQPLGLVDVRVRRLVFMSVDWLMLMHANSYDAERVRAHDIVGLYGCGEYAEDSWRIFADGDLDTGVMQSGDKELRKYLQEQQELHGGDRGGQPIGTHIGGENAPS